jgi:glyoxylase-like metal-dependent hydrolase (beta-lactamase superfamily II)
MNSEIKKIHVTETKEAVSGVFAIKDSYVNMFLVKDNNNYVAIDAGANLKTIREELEKLNIDSSKVSAIFLTHCDGDHTAALTMFSSAKLFMSRDEEQMINGKTAKLMFVHNKISRTDYTLLDDQQTQIIGTTKILGIATPGHTSGSMSYLINDSLLFVGDAFGLENEKISKPNSFFTGDMKTAVKSFAKIADLQQAKYIFTAHTGFTTDYKAAMADWKSIKE